MSSNQFDPYNNPRGQYVYAANTKPAKIDLLNDNSRASCSIDGPTATSQQVDYSNQQATTSGHRFHPQLNQMNSSSSPSGSSHLLQPKVTKTVTTTVSEQITTSNQRDLDELEKSLMEKEAALKRELAYLNQYSNPWSRPVQIREPRKEPSSRSTPTRNEGRWHKECPSNPNSRPTSRSSNSKQDIEADLMEKAAKLLKDVEELERIPLNKQQILIEVGTKRPMPSNSTNENVSSIHTAVIKVPSRQVDNKSPLPFAYDNFSTLGVRGNIASVGATPPEKPYAPIFPTLKRTPSPTGGYGRQ